MDVSMFDEFVGEELTAAVQQQIRKIHGDENPIKFLREGTAVSLEPRPGRLLIHLSSKNVIQSFSRG